jgi:CBS domain-containing protein
MKVKTRKVSDVMTGKVRLVDPDETLQQAAHLMAELDAGSLPVAESDRLVGMITDRDIAIRGVAVGKGPQAKVRDVMSPEVKYCFEDQEVEDVARNMGDIQLRRLPVVNRDKQLVGILSLGDIALKGQKSAGDALGGISRSGGAHQQTT